MINNLQLKAFSAFKTKVCIGSSNHDEGLTASFQGSDAKTFVHTGAEHNASDAHGRQDHAEEELAQMVTSHQAPEKQHGLQKCATCWCVWELGCTLR